MALLTRHLRAILLRMDLRMRRRTNEADEDAEEADGDG